MLLARLGFSIRRQRSFGYAFFTISALINAVLLYIFLQITFSGRCLCNIFESMLRAKLVPRKTFKSHRGRLFNAHVLKFC
jgi:hypothetical protein